MGRAGTGPQRLCQVAEEMKPICNLDSPRCTSLETLGIRTGTIPADDPDGGMSLQPCQRLWFMAWKKFNGLAPLEIHEHCPITMTAAPVPIVHPEDLHITSGSLEVAWLMIRRIASALE
jgi:hypothetical protein